MPISLTIQNSQIQIQILKGPFWQEDLNKIKALSSRKWNGESKLWIVPVECLNEINSKWEKHELFFTSKSTTEPSKEIRSLTTYPQILEKIDYSRFTEKTPKPFQEKYIKLNRTLRRTILAMPTGSGKSMVSILRYLILEDKKLLIVCPKILKTNWKETLRIDFGLDSLVYWGTAKQKEKLDINSKNIVITTYETISDIDRYDFDHIIVDEAHLLSNPKSTRFKVFKDYFDKLTSLKSVQLLSGTPIQHKVKDIWALVHLIDPILAGTYKAWCDDYEEVVKSFKKKIILKDRYGNTLRGADGKPKMYEKEVPLVTKTKNLPKLRNVLSSVLYRVPREEALECKETPELIYLELTKAQERLYHAIKNEILVELENKTLSLAHAPVKMLRLLQACEGLFNFSGVDSGVKEVTDSVKLEYLCHEIENNSDEKLVIWSRFKPITKLLSCLYPDKVAIYNGDVSDPLKQLSIWAFNGVKDKEQEEQFEKLKKKYNYPFNPGEAKVWTGVIDPKSSLGFDLHNNCNRQIFSSYSFLSSANYQASSRLVRLGQKEEFVSTEYLVASNTIEPAALNLILKNFSTALNIVDGEKSIHFSQINKLISLLKESN